VPAFLNGLIAAITVLGATGLLALTGAFYLIGADALCLGLGYLAGFVLAGVVLAPFLRKFGAYTLPSYLGQRFESRTVRVSGALLLALPVLLILVAEIRVGAALAKGLLGINRGNLIWPAAIAILITIAPGGMRSLTWSNAAWALVALIALLVPVTILSLLMTNLPFPQLTYGRLLGALGHLEAGNGIFPRAVDALAFELPSIGNLAMAKPFAQQFGAIGPTSFALVALTVMAGTAAMPSLLVRAGTNTSVADTRRALVWSLLLLGLVLLTLPAIAVFARTLVLTELAGKSPDRLPEWFQALVQTGQASYDAQAAKVQAVSLRLRRDGVLLALPQLAGFPAVLTYLAASGIVAAALAGASARLLTLANMASEDLLYGARRRTPTLTARLAAARIALGLTAALAAFTAFHWNADPMRLVLWGMSLAAATVLPVLVMSIWWKRINAAGAAAGMAAGFTVTGLAILGDALLDGPGWLGIDSTLSAVFGIPAGIAAAMLVSLLTPAPAKHVRELVRDLRVPGGETIHDREVRLSRTPPAFGP
jgi:cation/acetate symporter